MYCATVRAWSAPKILRRNGHHLVYEVGQYTLICHVGWHGHIAGSWTEYGRGTVTILLVVIFLPGGLFLSRYVFDVIIVPWIILVKRSEMSKRVRDKIFRLRVWPLLADTWTHACLRLLWPKLMHAILLFYLFFYSLFLFFYFFLFFFFRYQCTRTSVWK